MTASFRTPIDAHNAFYRALERSDFELMQSIWLAEDPVICVHPLWPPLTRYDDVIDSWKGMFDNGETFSVTASIISTRETRDHCVHLVEELLTAPGAKSPHHPIIATNQYVYVDQSWHMTNHHASPTARIEQMQNGPGATGSGPTTQLH